MNKKIIVIGGGINGITCALTLQLFGYETTCYAAQLVDDNIQNDPRFSSLFPAASIIPHSVQTNLLDLLFPASLSVFNYLYETKETGVIKSRHFEVSEFIWEQPEYTKFLKTLSLITPNDATTNIPRRNNASSLFGWCFDCLLAQWPIYMQNLYKWYQEAGGQIIKKKLERDDISQLPAEIIINCSGLGTLDLFDDKAKPQIVRGHLVHIENRSPIYFKHEQRFSYNYTPSPSTYATPNGDPCDVYFYPVSGKWILGGSRQHGSINLDGNWNGQTYDDTIPISGHDVPRPIIELNRQILKMMFDIALDVNSRNMEARVGYRFLRSADNDLRLEATEAHGKKIIHNYGHGGAGVSLSWGCALKVCQLINKNSDKDGTIFDKPILKGLQGYLREIYLTSYLS